MDLSGKAKRVRVYLNEGNVLALVAFLRRENAAGVSVFRVVEGFGASGRMHTERLVDAAFRVPEVLESIDTRERVEALLPRLKAMVVPGLITVEEVDVIWHAQETLRRLSTHLRVADIMSRHVVSVTRTTPARAIAELMRGQIYRSLPVVEGGVPVGIIAGSDLIVRGGLGARVELLARLTPEELRTELERIHAGKTAEDVMTPSPITVLDSASLPQVANTMAERRLKRLPVVDKEGALVGMVSRLDVLRTVAEGFSPAEAEPHDIRLAEDVLVGAIMRRDVPVVHRETLLADVVQAVVSTRLNRAIVVDDERRVVGLITDAELLDRVAPSLRPSALRSLVHRLPFVHPSSAQRTAEHHATARTAADLMTTDIATVREDSLVGDALVPMLRKRELLLAVTDDERRLRGMIDRADVLRALISPRPAAAPHLPPAPLPPVPM